MQRISAGSPVSAVGGKLIMDRLTDIKSDNVDRFYSSEVHQGVTVQVTDMDINTIIYVGNITDQYWELKAVGERTPIIHVRNTNEIYVIGNVANPADGKVALIGA